MALRRADWASLKQPNHSSCQTIAGIPISLRYRSSRARMWVLGLGRRGSDTIFVSSKKRRLTGSLDARVIYHEGFRKHPPRYSIVPKGELGENSYMLPKS